jgi:hypothetical protein
MQEPFPLHELEAFIVRAKSKTYVGGGQKLLSYRLGSKDLQFHDGDWVYHDSYFGNTDFIGQEVVYFRRKPVWAMNYYGYILKLEQITAAKTIHMIRCSLAKMYEEGRFLGAFEHVEDDLRYVDSNEGAVTRFHGKEQIYRNGQLVYELVYHGGLLQD